jgi:DNA-binding NarL/FixJ family response regulator
MSLTNENIKIDYAKTTLLFLDNYIENKKDITNSLRFKFNCVTAKNPKDLVFSFHKYEADFIIIGENNLDLLAEIIKDIKSSDINSNPTILVSSNDSCAETRIKCFEMGADDFIAKPYLPEELSHKIKNLLQFKEEALKKSAIAANHQLEKQNELINTTMKQASKYGSTLQLIKKLHSCSTVSDISYIIFSYLKEWGLNASLMFKDNQGNLEFFDCDHGECSPIEKKVLEMVGQKSNRLFSFQNRTIFVSDSVNLLIKNMPTGQLNYDLYIDILATLIESIEAHYEVLLRTQGLEKSQDKLESLMKTINDAMLKAQLEKNDIMDEFLLMVGQSFHVLEFNQEQEDKLHEMLEYLLKKHATNSFSFTQIQTQANEAISILKEELVKSKSKLKDMKTEDDDDDCLF